MHIVIANQWFPPERGWGGVAMFNHTFAHALRELGHQVTVIASRVSNNTAPLENINGIQVHRLLVRDHYRFRKIPVVGFYLRSVQQLSYSRRLMHHLKRTGLDRQADILEFTDVNAEGFFYLRSPRAIVNVRCQTPNFVLSHYYHAQEMPYDTNIISHCERSAIRRAHSLSAPSLDMANTIAAACQLDRTAIEVIPDAVAWRDFQDLPALDENSVSELTVLYVGRVERAKGVYVLVDAIPRVLKEIPYVRFVIVGADRPTVLGASTQRELETKLGQLDIRSKVLFTGAVNQAELHQWYGRADLCVVPSMLYESFSYTCAHAMAAGRPVVASAIGGIPETINPPECGLVVNPGDDINLAQCIVQLLLDRRRSIEMGQAGRRRVRSHFDPLIVAQQNISFYQRIRQSVSGRRPKILTA